MIWPSTCGGRKEDRKLSALTCNLLAVVGQTASGKSDLALKLAKELNGEIICADSWTVYKAFDIGTGKPSQSDQKAVKHWLLDVTEADAGFNAPLFQKMANQAIADIQHRGKLPIIAGGTGLYIDSVLYNFSFIDDVPGLDAGMRQKLDAMELPELLSMAAEQAIDLSELDTRNKRRVIRAIESGGQKPTKQPLRPGALIVGLQLPPEQLKSNVEKRVNRMVAAGFVDELKRLSEEYGWEIEPMKGIGYRAFRPFLEGRISLDEAKTRFIKGDLNLAKRQRTWFKRNPDIHWFSSIEQAHELVIEKLKSPST